MKIVVLVKQVPDTEEERALDAATGILDRAANERVLDEITERALEVALSYKDANKTTEIVVLSMGPDTLTTGLRKALSMGADSAVHVQDDALAGSDARRTAAVLASALRGIDFDLVVAGNESTDGRGGVVPSMIAEHLDLPSLTFLDSVELTDTTVSGERTAEAGALAVSASLPAVISVTERAAEPRFPNFKGIMTAKKKPLAMVALADLQPAPAEGAGSIVVSVSQRPARVAGTKITDTGDAGTQLAEFLAAGRLI